MFYEGDFSVGTVMSAFDATVRSETRWRELDWLLHTMWVHWLVHLSSKPINKAVETDATGSRVAGL